MFEWQEILFPDRPAAQLIIIVIGAVFGGWSLVLLYSYRKYYQYLRELMAYKQIDELREGIMQHHSSSEASSDDSFVQPLSIFAEYLESRRKAAGTNANSENGPVQVHLWTIFLAGWRENRLDTSELLKLTNNQIFGTIGLLRGVLAAFLVIGLLGTLIGLSDSLSQMQPTFEKAATKSSASSAAAMEMIASLKNAFAPSVWGVLATLLGLFIFFPFQYFVCQSLKHNLESLTIGVWVPNLMPTTSQKFLDTLQKSEEQMRRNFEAAQTVADFASNIKDEVQDFSPALKKANNSLRGITSAATEMNTSVERFGGYVGKLQSFQVESGQIQQQIANNMDSIRDSALVTAKLQESLQTVLKSASTAIESLTGRNQEVVDALGQPLREELISGLHEMKNTLQGGLSNLQNRLANMDAPLNRAADIMQGSLEQTTIRIDALLSALQREFSVQNQNNTEQIKNMNVLAGKIAELLESLKKIKNEEADIGKLSGSVEKLEVSMQTLVAALRQQAQTSREVGKPVTSWISVTAVTVSIFLLIGFGYIQHRNSVAISEMVQQNKQFLTEFQKMNSPIPSASTLIPKPGVGNSTVPDSRTPNKTQSTPPTTELPATSPPSDKITGQTTSVSPISNSPTLPATTRSQ